MICAKEAKRLEAVQKALIKKFRDAEKEERLRTDRDSSERAPPQPQPPTPIVNEPLTVGKAKQLEALQSKLRHEFAEVHTREIEEMRENEKQFESITRAIREQKEKDEEKLSKEKEMQKKKRFNQLMRLRPSASSTPDRRQVGYMGSNADDDEEDRMEVEEEAPAPRLNQSMKQLMDTKIVTLGSIGARYFPRANDPKFGIWYDEQTDRPKIGSEAITFDHDDIILIRDNKEYRGTEGLWKLLTKKDHVEPNQYTANDWNAYKDILLRTNALYQRNDPTTNRPKSSQGSKWKRMIKQIWDEHVKTDVEGSGLRVYTENAVEYKYVSKINELINRLNYIYAQEMAGNNNFHNEKLSLVKFLYDRLEELVKTPKGVKYLVRCLSALPEGVIQGSGLLNDIINKLPFELHAPSNWNFDTYNYCGPGTKLQQRLARGDKGINPLDEACKEHDIWYRDHKNTEDRWVADKVLQQKAWDRVTSADADLNERAIGLATTGGMWLKRKLGMGLGTSACVYHV